MKKPLIVLTGPTAAGKTHLSIALAKAVNGEIISADSMQVYKYMDIGSAKIRPEEMQGVKHYLVDELLPQEEFHIVKFQQMAKAAMKEIYAKGKIPVLLGGDGFTKIANVGDKVEAGAPIIEVDWAAIEGRIPSKETMVMITNTAKFNISKDSESRRPVAAGDRVAQATKK